MVGLHHLLKEALYRRNVTFRAQHKFDSIPLFIKCAIQILPLLPDFDVRLIDAVGSSSQLQVRAGAFIDLGRIRLNPSPDRDMIHRESALTHHLFKVAVA